MTWILTDSPLDNYLISLSGLTIRKTNSHFKSLEGHLLIREMPQDFVPKKVLTSLSTISKKAVPPFMRKKTQ